MFTYNYNTNNRTPIRVDNRIIGYIESNCFHRKVRGSQHQLRSPKAWCISRDAFYEEILPNAKHIIIEDMEIGQNYNCMTDEFARNCFEIKRGAFEPQLAMRLEKWHTETEECNQLTLWEENDK